MISYEPFYKFIRDKQVTIKDIEQSIGICIQNTMATQRYLNTEAIEKICFYLKCNVCDIIEWKDISSEKEISKVTIKESFFEQILNNFSSYREASLSLEKSVNYFQQLSKKRTVKKYIFQKLCSKLNLNAEDYYD